MSFDSENFTMLDNEKSDIIEYLNDEVDDYIVIRNIEAGTFMLGSAYFSTELLDFTIKIIREKQISLKWNIGPKLLFNYKNEDRIFKKESFWKLIANHDRLSIDWAERSVIILYEELMQLIQGIQLDSIEFIARYKFDYEGQKVLLMEILKTIKQSTRAKIIYDDKEI